MREMSTRLWPLTLVNVAFDVRELLLHEAGRISHPLVVHRGAKLTNEEIEHTFGAEVTDPLIELLEKVLLDGTEQLYATVLREPDSQG